MRNVRNSVAITEEMRDLLKEPLWKEEHLGAAIPDVRHACSVCLPTWQTVIDYEEGRDRVMRSLQAGYPRFAFHPDVAALFAVVREEYAVLFHKDNFEQAKLFWRYTGEGVSSRLAQRIVENQAVPELVTNARTEMAKFFGDDERHVHLWQAGMSAIFAVHRFVCAERSGRKTLQVEFPYVDSLRTQQSFGVGVVFLANCQGEDLRIALERIREREFAAVFAEVPANPMLKTPAIIELSKACQASQTLLVVDDTVASHYNVDVLKYADVVTTSCTKWISGKGDVMAGSTRINPESPFAKQLEIYFDDENSTGSTLAEEDAQVLLENLKGFEQRMQKVNKAGEAVADFLNSHPAVEDVYYPKFTTPELYDSLKTEKGGYGGLISIVLKNEKKTPIVYDALELTKGPSLGTEFTLVSPYTMLAHYEELDWAEDHDVSRNLIRFSIGIESPDYLVDVIGNALDLG